MIRVLIADDLEEIREYLTSIFADPSHQVETVGTAASGAEAYQKCAQLLPDVVLMDIQMESRMAGIEAIAAIRADFPGVKCIVLTIHADDEFLFQAYLVGASDFIVKTEPAEKIVSSIKAVMANQLLLRPETAQKIIGEYQRLKDNEQKQKRALEVMMKISTVEYEILRLINQGYSYKDMAEFRNVEETTIRSQVSHILKKFDLHRMKDVIKILHGLNILDD